MKAQELRIGNWIETLSGMEQCVDVLCDSVNTKSIEGINYGEINPIPLTEEWLVKFGFEKRRYIHEGIIFGKDEFWDLEYYIAHDIYEISQLEIDNLKYVHQLQNLYFALTGNELEINS